MGKQSGIILLILFFLINFSLAKEIDFSSIDSQDNFLVSSSSENFHQQVPVDFIFPLALKQEDLKKAVETKEKQKISGWRYVVKKGETLWQISKKFKVSLRDLLYYNDLSENSILKAGDKIIIPGAKPQAIITTKVKQFAGKFVSALTEIQGLVVPVSGFNWGHKHGVNGTDIAAPCGSEVYASNSGIVVESSDGWNNGYGNYIIIKHKNGFYSLYGHLSLRVVETGDEVEKGELIGYVGNTGYTVGPTGCHLHFEIRGASNPLLK